jgi:hypothetical protein
VFHFGEFPMAYRMCVDLVLPLPDLQFAFGSEIPTAARGRTRVTCGVSRFFNEIRRMGFISRSGRDLRASNIGRRG